MVRRTRHGVTTANCVDGLYRFSVIPTKTNDATLASTYDYAHVNQMETSASKETLMADSATPNAKETAQEIRDRIRDEFESSGYRDDLNTLRDDMAQLRKDIQSIGKHLRDDGRSAGQRARSRFEDAKDEAREKAEELKDRGEQRIHEQLDRAERVAHDHPLATAAALLGAGVILGQLLSRGDRR